MAHGGPGLHDLALDKTDAVIGRETRCPGFEQLQSRSQREALARIGMLRGHHGAEIEERILTEEDVHIRQHPATTGAAAGGKLADQRFEGRALAVRLNGVFFSALGNEGRASSKRPICTAM